MEPSENTLIELGKLQRSTRNIVEILLAEGGNHEQIIRSRKVFIELDIKYDIDDYDWQKQAKILHLAELIAELELLK